MLLPPRISVVRAKSRRGDSESKVGSAPMCPPARPALLRYRSRAARKLLEPARKVSGARSWLSPPALPASAIAALRVVALAPFAASQPRTAIQQKVYSVAERNFFLPPSSNFWRLE